MIDVVLIVWAIGVTVLSLIGVLRADTDCHFAHHHNSSFEMKMLLHQELQNIFEERPDLIKPFIDAINQWQIQGSREKI